MGPFTEDKWVVGHGHETFPLFFSDLQAGTALGSVQPNIEVFDTEEEAKARVLEIDPTYEFEPPEEEEDDLIDLIE